MGALKLAFIEEQEEQKKAKMRFNARKEKSYHVGSCSCPCWAFIKEGKIVMDDMQSTASWNID